MPRENVTLAEQAFVTLARQWRDMAEKAGRDGDLPGQADMVSLACLLLAVEWGWGFSKAADSLRRENDSLARQRLKAGPYAILDMYVWELCEGGIADESLRAESMYSLRENMTHHNSAIRKRIMTMAWMVRHWFTSDDEIALLLKNVADTLCGFRMAFGLARGLCVIDEELELFVVWFNPPDGFADQFADRITMFREEGFVLSQKELWECEARCRRMTQKAVFGMTVSNDEPDR